MAEWDRVTTKVARASELKCGAERRWEMDVHYQTNMEAKIRRAGNRTKAVPVNTRVASRKLRVLLVNEWGGQLAPLIDVCQRWGHEARTARGGCDALRVAASQHPDVVLVGTDFPEMNTCQMSRQLRRDFPRDACFLIAVTNCLDDGCREQLSEVGFDLALPAPVSIAVVETLLILESLRAVPATAVATRGALPAKPSRSSA